MLAVTQPVEAALKKRCDAWHLRLDKMSFDSQGGPEARTRALQDVAKTYASQSGSLQAVAKAHVQWLDRLKQQVGADRFGEVTLVLDSRLLLHLGRANVLENVGLYCDRTTGLPLIPGTALKGVVSTWACWAAHQKADLSIGEFTKDSTQRRNFTAAEARLAQRILGDDSSTGSEHAGEVIFLGGFPTSPPKLGLDIVNPHHRSDGSAETRLTPSAFLCVEPGTQWQFAFYARPVATDAVNLLATTKRWIEEALTQTGIGAKTAAGYGRFRQPTDADRAAEQGAKALAAQAAAAAAKQAAAGAEKAKQQAAAQAAMQSDYPNDVTFKNAVLSKLNPGQLEQLRPEIEKLQKPENQTRCNDLKQRLATKEYKDIRKRLREKDWFPKDWLPPQ